MWGYLAVLLIGFWLGVAIFLYVSCYWLDEILDLPGRSSASSPTPSTSASNAHAQLKRLVARVVEEAAALPALAQYAAEPPRTPSVEGATYEDLLATAILNKVIERYQTENGSGGRSSGIHSASASPTPSERSSPRSLRGQLRDITPPLHEEDEEGSDWERGEEPPRRVPFPEFGGDIVHATDNDDRDFDEVSGSDIQASDGTWEENWLFQKKKIKTMQSVPVPMLVPNSNTDYRALIGDRDADDTTDLSDNASENEEDDTEYKSDIKRVLDSKHLIGGKTKIEELDFEPDSLNLIDDNGKDVTDAINMEVNAIVDATETVNSVMKEDSVMVLGIDSGPLSKAEFNVKEEIHRTFLNANGYIPNGSINSGTDSLQANKDFRNNTLNGHEREGEYEETVTLPVQRYADSLRRKHFDVPQTIPTRDTDNDEDLIPGSIADRERKKWLNYVEMPNNPYSPEAIQKRLSAKSTSSLFDMITKGNIDEPLREDEVDGKVEENSIEEKKEVLTDDVEEKVNGNASKSPSPKILKEVLAEEVPQYKRYGRDYYIKEARLSAGGRKRGNFSDSSSVGSINKSISMDNLSSEMATGLLIQQFNSIASNQDYTKFDKTKPKYTSITMITSNDDRMLIDYEDNHLVYEAKPVCVNDDTDKKTEDITQSPHSSEPSSLNIEIESKSEIDEGSPKSPIDSILSNSSLDDSIKIYNVPTGEIVRSKDKLSERYDADSNGNIDIPDKNATVSRQDAADCVPVIVEEILRENQLGSIAEVDEVLPKVKELAKKFVSMDNLSMETNGNDVLPVPKVPITKRRKSRDNILQDMQDQSTKHLYMHSLTARSISREFRQELKLSMATPLKFPGGTNEVPEGIEDVVKESSRPGSPVPEPGNIKSKLAFFESLKSKFSTK